MHMEYSADDLTAAGILQYFGYICTILVTLWTYDYVCSLREESTFLLQSRWTKVKALYIITRYAPFCLVITNMYLALVPNENVNKCRMLIDIYTCFAVISLTGSECFFVLRTYALWSSNRMVLVAMLSTLVTIIVSFVSLWFTAIATSNLTISAIPGITGCYRISNTIQLTVPFILLFVFQLVLISLTLIRAIQSWRSTSGPLHAVLLKHNTFYYVCGLRESELTYISLIDNDYHSESSLGRERHCTNDIL
ncbi:hypothetical protein DEU56DRAFT_804754 [Suillus clintonianus]|uniref:uncharacterized protein n=1 Tax=Suillus clintonianus TaxID=1904413 RepID=UPI001B8731FD|nr:uncharacterized protein DEU56DRAFT_804754 [Suillus clintonianus]KAG2137044.1 hypothetical protein DEU56DRAFT_804754 [Suillus clintonianus]